MRGTPGLVTGYKSPTVTFEMEGMVRSGRGRGEGLSGVCRCLDLTCPPLRQRGVAQSAAADVAHTSCGVEDRARASPDLSS